MLAAHIRFFFFFISKSIVLQRGAKIAAQDVQERDPLTTKTKNCPTRYTEKNNPSSSETHPINEIY